MKGRIHRYLPYRGFVIALAALNPVPLHAQELPTAISVEERPGLIHGLVDQVRGYVDPRNAEITTVHQIACLIDHLDKSLQCRGQVVVKGPDVWGSNRLTQARVDYETEMAKQLTKFEVVLSGYQRRADLAALTSATSVGASVGPQIRNSRNVSTTTNVTPAPAAPAIPSAVGLVGSSGLVANANSLLGGPASALLLPSSLTSLALANQGSVSGIGVEPTVLLDERSRFINHLDQLRRINVGDDRTDMPGYSLYLVRMPVSILPGAQSIKGKGAIVTVEAKHNLTSDLLPNTFRNVVILDTAYQLADLVTRGQYLQISDDGRCNCDSNGVPKLGPITSPTPPDGGAASSGSRPGNKLPGAQALTGAAPAPAGAGSRGLAGLSSTESVAIYGEANLRELVCAVKGDQESWYRHDPSVVAWLISEITNAHGYMKEQSRLGNVLFQPDVFETLGNLALLRDYQALAFHREEWLQALAEQRNETGRNGELIQGKGKRRVRPTDILAFALMVQSVMLDRQIKYDMQVIIERKHCQCGDPFQYSFASPWPDDAARQAFNAYVACKWPIHVFSLDPVVDQQNQLDLFSQRTELQLALATAVATGQVSFQNATTYARRLEKDLADINLNRTAIGFGAGDTTFGWRFYPRLQTPPTESNPRRISNILLFNGPGPDYAQKHSLIEPGLRECYALMVIPNFAPAIRFTTVTNWFDLKTKHPRQELETTDMVRLGRKLQTARDAMQRLCDSGSYRPVEVELLADRLSQLESLLPLQSHEVTLPFEADLSGSEIFTSTNSALAPRLLTWYGEPPIEGADSAIFILGSGFTVHEMKAIAGGQTLADQANLEMLSRNVLRIVIPKTAVGVDTNVLLRDENGQPIPAKPGTPGVSDVQTIRIKGKPDKATFKLEGIRPDTHKTFAPFDVAFDINSPEETRDSLDASFEQALGIGNYELELLPTKDATGKATDAIAFKLTLKGELANLPMPLLSVGPPSFAGGTNPSVSVVHTKTGSRSSQLKYQKRRVIDVHVASPNGISNHLLVELLPTDPNAKSGSEKQISTTATTTTKTNADGSTSVTTEFKTTPPGVVLPPGTYLPLGGNLPVGTQVAPGAAQLQGTPAVFPPGTVPNTSYPPANTPAGGSQAPEAASSSSASPASEGAASGDTRPQLSTATRQPRFSSPPSPILTAGPLPSAGGFNDRDNQTRRASVGSELVRHQPRDTGGDARRAPATTTHQETVRSKAVPRRSFLSRFRDRGI